MNHIDWYSGGFDPFCFIRVGANFEQNGIERNTLGCEWVTLVIGGIYDIRSGLKIYLDVDLFGSFMYLRGVWKKVRNGSNCGFGWFRSGFKRSLVIGEIYWR